MSTMTMNPAVLCEELPVFKQVAAMLDFLKDGAADAVNETALRAWGDIVQVSLLKATVRLQHSIECLEAEYVQAHVARRAKEENV